MHNTFFTRFAAAGIAIAPLTLVSALVWIDGSYAGQAKGQRDATGAPDSTAQTRGTTRPRALPPLRSADPTLDGLGYSADALVFGRASDPDSDPNLFQAPAPGAITPTSPRGGPDEGSAQSRADGWATGLTPPIHGATPYGRNWVAAPQAAWNTGRPGARSAFTAAAGSAGPDSGSQSPAGSPEMFYAPENPVAVLTAASRGATPAESTEEPLALLTAPVITARDATSRAIPEPSALGLALGALGLAGIGHRSRRPARRSGG